MQLIVYINQTFDQEEALPWLRHCLCSCNTVSINCISSSSNRASGVNCQSITWLSHRLCFSNKTASCDEDKICEFSVLQQYFDRLLTVIITAADHQQAQQASVLALLKALIPPIISAANFLCNSDSTIILCLEDSYLRLLGLLVIVVAVMIVIVTLVLIRLRFKLLLLLPSCSLVFLLPSCLLLQPLVVAGEEDIPFMRSQLDSFNADKQGISDIIAALKSHLIFAAALTGDDSGDHLQSVNSSHLSGLLALLLFISSPSSVVKELEVYPQFIECLQTHAKNVIWTKTGRWGGGVMGLTKESTGARLILSCSMPRHFPAITEDAA